LEQLWDQGLSINPGQAAVGQRHTQFVQVQDAYAHVDGHTQVFPIAGDADLAAHVEPDGFGHHLFQGFMGCSGHGAGAHMGVCYDILPFRGHYGPLYDLFDAGQEFAPEIYGSGPIALLAQVFFQSILFFPGGRQRHAQGCPSYIDTGNGFIHARLHPFYFAEAMVSLYQKIAHLAVSAVKTGADGQRKEKPMSVIMAEELKAGVILGDRENDQYLYMPGSEIGSDDPVCIFEESGSRTDLHLKEAVELAKRLTLKPTVHPVFGKRAY
jgi:hypothetical protein